MFNFIKFDKKTKELNKASPPLQRKSVLMEEYHGGGRTNIAQWVRGKKTTFSNSDAYTFYESCAPLANVVNKIARAVASLDVIVKNQENQPVSDSDITKVLKNPGFGQTYHQLLMDYAVSYLLTGNGYLIADPNKVTLRSPKGSQVTVIADKEDGFPGKYEVANPNGKTLVFNRKEIGDMTFTDPLGQELFHLRGQTRGDGLYGRSPIEALVTEIIQAVAGGQHNVSLLMRGATPNGALIAPGSLTETQLSGLQEAFDRNYSGPDNAGKVMVLEGGLEYKNMSISNKDMDFMNILRNSKEQIAAAYAVPLPLVSTDSMTLSNYTTAVEAFYDEAVFPVAEYIFDSIGRVLGLEENYRLTFDKDEVSAIRERRIREAKERHSMGILSDNESRAEIGYEPYPGGDAIYKTANLVPVGQDAVQGQAQPVEQPEDAKHFIDICDKIGISSKRASELWRKGIV